MPVRVENVKTYVGNGTYIGRAREHKYAPLSNPFTHLPQEKANPIFQVSTREEAIEKYREWVHELWETDEWFRIVITSLTRDHLRGKEVVLACHCAPEPCHGDVLKELIEQMAEYGAVTLADEDDIPPF